MMEEKEKDAGEEGNGERRRKNDERCLFANDNFDINVGG